jgi:hypothetical protein
MVKTFSTLLVLAGLAAAQPVGAGLKVGGLLNEVLSLSNSATLVPFTAEAHRYIVGPYFELRLPFQMAVEVDALYRNYDFRNGAASTGVSSWEFPMLLKHKILAGPVKPYFEGGLSFNRLADVKNVSINHLTNYGIVAGGGVELHLLVLKISPEVRYNGWIFRSFDGLAQSHRNQVSLLVGIGF